MIPADFKNLINPWQTKSEIDGQVKFLYKMFIKLNLTKVAFREMALLDKPDWNWSKPK